MADRTVDIKGAKTVQVKVNGHNKPKPRQGSHAEPSEYKCLIRATLANRKISTVIHHKDITKFQMAYGNMLKANVDGLKKKDKRSAKGKKPNATN